MTETTIVLTRAMAGALVYHLRALNVSMTYSPLDLILHLATEKPYMPGLRVPVEIKYDDVARPLCEAFKLAALDPINQPNFKAACRHRAIQLAVALGASAVDIIAELNDAA